MSDGDDTRTREPQFLRGRHEITKVALSQFRDALRDLPAEHSPFLNLGEARKNFAKIRNIDRRLKALEKFIYSTAPGDDDAAEISYTPDDGQPKDESK